MNYPKEIKTRASWLLLGLALSLGIAKVISGFEATLQENLILASFIPLIVYMSDAVGTQMEAMIIREFNKKQKFRFRKFFREQVIVVVSLALIIGLVACVAVSWFNDSVQLGLVVGISLIGGIVSSLLSGTLLPYFFWKMHDDPAEASGPIATAIQDLMSVLIFFLIAQTLL